MAMLNQTTSKTGRRHPFRISIGGHELGIMRLRRFSPRQVKVLLACLGVFATASPAGGRVRQGDGGPVQSQGQTVNRPAEKASVTLTNWPEFPLWNEKSGMKKDREIPVTERIDSRFPELRKVKGILLDEMRKFGYPGCTFCMMRNGKVVYQFAAGWSDKDLKTPMQINARMRSASVEKGIIGTLMCRLIDEGWQTKAGTRITRETPIFRVLCDEWGLKPISGQVVDPRIFDVTIGSLLEHKSGINDADVSWGTVDALKLNRAPNSWEIMRHLLGKPLLSPGTFRYSNTGFDVLRWFCECLTGDYFKAVGSELWKPAGANPTDFSLSGTLPAERAKSEPYYWADWKAPSLDPANFRKEVFGLEGAINTGGVRIPAMTVTDLTLFANLWRFHSPEVLFDPATGRIDPRRLGDGTGVLVGACGGTSSVCAQGHHTENGQPGWWAFSGLWNYCAEGCTEQSNLVDRMMKEVLSPLGWCAKPQN